MRTIRDAKLETRASRARLPAGPKPYWKTLLPGALHLGYRRKTTDTPGTWLVRAYLGKERYRVAAIGLADDFSGVGTLDFSEAQRLALTHRAATLDARALSVGEVVGDYISWLKVHRATAKDAEMRAAKLILPELGSLKVRDLTTTALNRWRDGLAELPVMRRGKVYGPPPSTVEAKRARRATVNRVIITLRAALNAAFRSGAVDDDLAWRRFRGFERTGAARTRFLTLAECRRLTNTADAASGFRDLVIAALMTGCRYSELAALRVRDFHRGKLAILRSKSGRPRDITLSEEATAFFEQLTAGRAGDELMLRRGDGGWAKDHQDKPMRAACAAANIIPPVGFHQTRHSWASHAVMNGMPLLVVARNLGHSSTAMVERHYGHLAETYIDDAIKNGSPTFGFEVNKKIVAL